MVLVDFSSILSWMSDVGLNLIWAYSTIFEIFSYTVNIFGSDYSVWSLIFTSSGVAIFLVVTIWKWIKGVVM